jgi:hypothetical protein
MRDKPRVLIVTGYGNPQMVNLWVRFYEQFIMDEVDEVYIANGGAKFNAHPQLGSANQKICDLTNKKHGNNKLRYFYFDTFRDDRTVSTHPHILYNAAQVAFHRHTDATLCFMDEDVLIMKKGYIDRIFSKLEIGDYKCFGHMINRPLFCNQSQSHYHSFLFLTDLKSLSHIMDCYDRSLIKSYVVNRVWEEWQSDYCAISKLSNFFGYSRYPKGTKFEDIDLEITCDGAGDETLWMFSTFFRRFYGDDKMGTMDNASILTNMFAIPGIDGDSVVFDSIANKDREMLHFGGGYTQYHFGYPIESEEATYLRLSGPDIAFKYCKILVNYETALKAWHWTKDEIDCEDLFGRMQRYLDRIQAEPNLPQEMAQSRVDKYVDAILSKLSD